tara:strand:- start:1936 stop:2340 length:405 start_codon:yes stop_codon:yes gene_type:complete
MLLIYCIEDINDLRYVGSTKQTFSRRLRQHRLDKTLGRNVSSAKLNLENCIMYELEEVNIENKYERETYWMSKMDTVNTKRGQTLDPNYMTNYGRQYYKDNKDKYKQYYSDNKEAIQKYHKEAYQQRKKKQVQT